MRISGRKTIPDAEAAFGCAATVHFPDMPFELGFHQWISREPAPDTPSGIHDARPKLDRDQNRPALSPTSGSIGWPI